MSQPGVVEGAVYEFHAARARIGKMPGVNSPLTTVLFDTSLSGNHGTLVNCDGTEWGGTGTLADPHALTLNGTDEYIVLPDLGAAEDKNFTYEAWVRLISAPAGAVRLIVEASNTSDKPAAYFNINSTGYAYGLLVGAASSVTIGNAGPSVCDGTPHHIALSCNGTHGQFYVDGKANGAAVALPADSPFSVGWTTIGTRRYSSTPNVGSGYFPGSLLVARIYPTGLSAANVATSFAAGYLWPDNATGRHSIAVDVDDSLWQIVAGSDERGWRDISDEVGALTYSNVRPGGAGSCSFTVPADVWGLGYNELQPDERLIIRYAGTVVWDGYVLPRGINYQGA